MGAQLEPLPVKFVYWLVLIAVCLLILSGLGWFKYREIQAGIEMGRSFPEPIETVEVFVAQQTRYQPQMRVTGEVVATQSANLSNELAGRIVEVGFKPGATVTQGQLLLALDTSEEVGQLKALQAAREIARLGFDRASRLVKRGAGSEEDRDRARAEYDGASANVERLQALIAKKQILAPFDATTSLHTLEVGQYLAANSTLAMLVGRNEALWVDFSLPQQRAAKVTAERVTILQGEQKIGEAEIIGRDAAVNSSSRNLSFRALLAVPDDTLVPLPGTLVSVEVAVGDPQSVVAVPATAIRRNSLGANVYVVDSNAKPNSAHSNSAINAETDTIRARRRSVTTGSAIDFDPTTQQQIIVIESGLAAGERVVANGAFKLRDGMRLNVLAGGPAGLGE